MESGGRDPQSGLGYTYLRFKDKKSVQLLGMFESDGWGAKLAMNESSENGEIGGESSHLALRSISVSSLTSSPLSSTAYAAEDYSSKYPGAFGKKLGIFVDATTNTPINEAVSYTSGLNLSLPSIASGTGVLVIGNTSAGGPESLSST